MADRSAYLATYAVTPDALGQRGHDVTPDVVRGRILRSVLMKPEADLTLAALHERVEALTERALRDEES